MPSIHARPPFPYPGGKRKWARLVWEAFGRDCIAYSEPFFGGGSVLLLNPAPCPREVVCDLSPHIVNFWRAVKHDPEAVAFHADLPTSQFELTARGKAAWAWAQDANERLAADEAYYDALRAGVWAWGMSNSIGLDFGQRGQDKGGVPSVGHHHPDGQGTQQQAARLAGQAPHASHNRGATGASGVQQQAGEVPQRDGGRGGKAQGVQQGGNEAGEAPQGHSHRAGAGFRGVSQMVDRGMAGEAPAVYGHNAKRAGRGVTQHVDAGGVPRIDDKHAGGYMGVQQGRNDGMAGQVPHADHAFANVGRAVMQQAGAVPQEHSAWSGARGVSQRVERGMAGQVPQQRDGGRGGKGCGIQQGREDGMAPVNLPFDGARLLPWITWLHERLRRVIVLSGDWTGAVTPTYLVHNDAKQRPAAIFLDPPYKMTKQVNDKYGLTSQEADDVATSAYLWAVENGGNQRYRIAFCAHRGDFEVPDGWTARTGKFTGIRSAARRKSSIDQIMFSPACFPDGKVEQPGLFSTNAMGGDHDQEET